MASVNWTFERIFKSFKCNRKHQKKQVNKQNNVNLLVPHYWEDWTGTKRIAKLWFSYNNRHNFPLIKQSTFFTYYDYPKERSSKKEGLKKKPIHWNKNGIKGI